MTLQQAISENINLHTQLVQAGINSTQALNFIMNPLEAKNIKESLEALTVNQLDEVILLLRNELYYVPNKKTAYQLVGLAPYRGEYNVILSDAVLEVDTIYLDLLELPQQLTQDILKTIRQIL